MKQDLTLNVGTHYNGEGFRKLDQGIRGAAAQVRNATKTINAMQGALGQVGGAVGKLSGLFGAFASGGAIGLAIAGVTALIKKFKDEMDEAKEAAKNAAKAYEEVWSNAIKVISDKFDKLKKERQADLKDVIENKQIDTEIA